MKLKQALVVTRRMWRWLAIHPEKRKQDWPGWQPFRYGYKGDMRFGPFDLCPCCTYANHTRKRIHPHLKKGTPDRCEYCPLRGYAWTGTVEDPCCQRGAPYAEWLFYEGTVDNLHVRAAHAAEIWKAAEEAMRDEGYRLLTALPSAVQQGNILKTGGRS